MRRIGSLVLATCCLLAGAAAPAAQMSLVIGIDGMGYGSMGFGVADTPNLNSLIDGTFGGGAYHGAYSDNAFAGGVLGTDTQQPTVSGPGWSTILTGVWANRHLVVDNGFTPRDYTNNPPYLKTLEASVPNIYTSSIVNWSPIDTYIISAVNGGGTAIDFHVATGSDATVATTTVSQLTGLDTNRPAAVFVSFDDVDAAGHAGGSSSMGYKTAIEDTDARVGTMLTAIANRPNFASEDWQIIVTADHGHLAGGGHGGQSTIERTVPFIVFGKNVAQGDLMPVPSQVSHADVSPTVLHHFGEASPSHYFGTWRGDLSGTPGDLNGDQSVTIQDWLVFRSEITSDLNGLSRVDAYLKGDLTGDGLHSPADYLMFRQFYVQAGGSAADLTNSVPEPSTLILCLAGILAVAARRLTVRAWPAKGVGSRCRKRALARACRVGDIEPRPGPSRVWACARWLIIQETSMRGGCLRGAGTPRGRESVSPTRSHLGKPRWRHRLPTPWACSRPQGQIPSSPDLSSSGRVQARFRKLAATCRCCLCAVVGMLLPTSAGAAILFSEDFNSLPLGPNVEESIPGAQVWTSTPPAGWSVDRTGVPGYNNAGNNNGVKEWIGWNFAKRDWWVQIAGDQGRSGFTKGSGTIMVADPDEWDDATHPPGTYNTYISSPTISLAGAAANSVMLTFDSSWVPFANQTGTLRASFNGGAPVTVFTWLSSPTSSPDYKPSAINESFVVPLSNPVGATTVKLTWGLTNAENDWFWAVDNIFAFTGSNPNYPHLTVYTNTGEIVLTGGLNTQDIDSYQITSAEGTLDTTYWMGTNLQAQGIDAVIDPAGATPGAGNDPGETWETLAGTPNQLWEAFFLGHSAFNGSRSESLGWGYDVVQDARNLAVTFTTSDGQLLPGSVEYATRPLKPDQNEDGNVDIFDVNVISATWDDMGYRGIPGDADLDGVVGIFDVNLISQSWNPGGGGAAAVPEPATLVLIALAVLIGGGWHALRNEGRGTRSAASEGVRNL